MIRGARCALRPVRETDLAALHALDDDPSLQDQGLELPQRSQRSLRKEFDETGFLGARRGRLLVTDLEDRLLGMVAYFEVGPGGGLELGYQLFDPARRNQGLMTEALGLAVSYFFGAQRVERLQLVIARANAASRRVAHKCGFRLDGRPGDAHPQRDALLYALRRGAALPARGALSCSGSGQG